MPNQPERTSSQLFARVAAILDAARTHVARSVNTAMVHAYWLVGREIVEEEQSGRERAAYGEQVIARLASELTQRFGKGFTRSSLKRMRQLYVAFPEGSTIPEELGGPKKGAAPRHLFPADENGAAPRHLLVPLAEPLFPPNLSWTHYRALVTVENPLARAFYEIEAVRESWSARELERQIAALLFERLSMSRDEEGVRALARRGQTVATTADVLKDPLVLEFLDLQERASWRERDLEQAIIDRLESFLLELGVLVHRERDQ